MKTTQKETIHHENYILELIKLVLPYKLSIAIITLLVILLARYYLYFIPNTYESYAIIKVKSHNEDRTQELISDNKNIATMVGIKQEMLSLQTFKINNQVLDKVDFSIQYFQKKDYKVIELYNDSPIHLIPEKESNLETAYGRITLTKKENGFTLSTKKLGESKVYPFNTKIETPYFSGVLQQKVDFHKPIFLVFNGDNRSIYQGIIKSKLFIKQVDKKANLIQVSFQDTIPERANNYVDTLIKIYMADSLYKKDKTNNRILSFLDIQLKSIKSKLEKSENALEVYKINNNVEPTVKVNDSFKKLSAIDLDLSALTLKEKLAKNLITFVKSNRNLDAIGPTLREFNDQATIKFIDTLEKLQEEKNELSVEFTDQYPKLISVKKRIKRIKNKIFLNVKNLKSTLVTKRKTLENQKKRYEEILKSLPKEEKKLVSLQRDYDVNSKMYTYLLKKKSENELIKVSAVSNYEIIDKAYTSLNPIKPKRKMALILATIIGFIMALVLSMLRALLIDKVATKTDIKLITKLPIYGTIPLYENNVFSTAYLKEAYHRLATNLQFTKKENRGSIILFSSHSQGEGKTTTVVNLAGVFQNSGYKTIVIDLNMREPSIHGHFGIGEQYSGMSTYLSQRDNIGNIIFSTNFENLDIIPAGPVPPNPSELVLSKRLTELFEILKQKYDYILIDTSAYNNALETLYLMKFSDTNLIILREKMSKKSTIVELEKIIQEKNLQNMGLVIKSIFQEKKESQNNLLSLGKRKTKTPIQLSI